MSIVRQAQEHGQLLQLAYTPERFDELTQWATSRDGDLFTGPDWAIELIREQREGLLTPREAAEYLRSSVSTLAHWRMNGRGPRYVLLGASTIRYHRRHLNEFIAGKVR